MFSACGVSHIAPIVPGRNGDHNESARIGGEREISVLQKLGDQVEQKYTDLLNKLLDHY